MIGCEDMLPKDGRPCGYTGNEATGVGKKAFAEQTRLTRHDGVHFDEN